MRPKQMNDKQRIQFLIQSQRLSTWLQRTKLTPAEFISFHRSQLDQLIAPIMPKKHKNIWRKWEDLSEKEQSRIVDKIRRRNYGAYYEANDDVISLRLHPSAKEPLKLAVNEKKIHKGRNYNPYIPGNKKPTSHYDHINHHKPWPDREGTPVERVHEQRLIAFKRILRERLKYRHEFNIEFIPNLHPNDVEIEVNDNVLSMIVDRAAIKFSKLLSDIILSANLYTTDNEVIEVYYCAVLIANKSQPRLEHCFIGRAKQIHQDKDNPLAFPEWQLTKQYTTANRALLAARKLYAQSAAKLINEDDDDE